MKNTVKKILALVFVVAMVCSLAVPAFANDGDDKVDVKINVVLRDGNVVSGTAEMDAKKATIENALETSTTVKKALTISSTTGKITTIALNKANYEAATPVLTKVTDDAIVGEFGTGSIVVALNGKAVAEDLDTVTVEEDDVITVYWADSTLGTKLAMVDDSAIAQGIIAFYYYDAEGNRQPLVDAIVDLNNASGDMTNYLVVSSVEEVEVDGKVETINHYFKTFKTDEKGQVWVAPEYLDAEGTIKVASVMVWPLDEIKEEDGYTKEEVLYYNANLSKNLVAVEVTNVDIAVEKDLYNVAGATGDMTVVYALVAFAAVATIAAVVVMKKKSVKAN